MNDSKQEMRTALRAAAVRDGSLCRCRKDAPPEDHHPKCDQTNDSKRGSEWGGGR